MSRTTFAPALLLLLAACAGTGPAAGGDPPPSAAFDGRYEGTRQSPPRPCYGEGASSARIEGGQLTLRALADEPEFIVVRGTVAADGSLRGRGTFAGRRSGDPIAVTLSGRIEGTTLVARGTDSQAQACVVSFRLTRMP